MHLGEGGSSARRPTSETTNHTPSPHHSARPLTQSLFSLLLQMSAARLPAALAATEEDISLLLAAQAHIGTKNVEKKMQPYVWKRRADGINIINIGKTWEKIVLAARIIAAVENPADVCVISARPYGHRVSRCAR